MKLNVYLMLQIFFGATIATSVSDYIKSVGEYFGYTQKNKIVENGFNNRIPYEVSTADEKFISEAAKLTGLTLSDLDSCQHRVVLKLQTDCHKMNDEQLAKMAVQLLNCQSYVEGRKMYPCTETMSIKQCTTSMDSDTWTSYHLMSNRARAVCYSIRQSQFRGLAEHTVNRLMDTAQNQLNLLGKISNEQKHIHSLAENTLDIVEKGHENILAQQKDMQAAQLHSQLTVEDNIKRLVDEKMLIRQSHEELARMTRDVEKKLEDAAKEIEKQAGKSKFNHQELMDDLIAIQNKAQIIYQRIEDSTELLIRQSEAAQKQYEATLAQLAEVNTTVHSLVALVGGTKQALEEKLLWLSTALGGTDLAVERLYLIMWHAAFLLLAMISCSFLAASLGVRLIVAVIPPLNLGLALCGNEKALDPLQLIAVVTSLVAVHIMSTLLWKLYQPNATLAALPWKKPKETPSKKGCETSSTTSSRSIRTSVKNQSYFESPLTVTESYETQWDHPMHSVSEDTPDELGSPTPPISRNGYYSRSRSRTPLHLNGSLKAPCKAKTRVGTPCKLFSLPGRDFCHRHQSGDSVMIS